MRAAIYYGNHKLEVEDVPEPSVRPGHVKVKVCRNGICGTDLHEYYDGPIFIPADGPHPLTGKALPLVMGHEFSGTVVEVGAGVADVAEGDRVTIEPIYRCGECRPCRTGHYNLCKQVGFHGLMEDGGMAEYTVVPRNQVHHLPDSVELELGALVEPMSVAYHAATLADLDDQSSALIYGAGPIGIGLWFALRGLGLTEIEVVEPSEHRRRSIEALGARTLDPTQTDIAGLVADRTDGDGVDAAFDARRRGVRPVSPRLHRRTPPPHQRRDLREAAHHLAHQPRAERAAHPRHDLLYLRGLPRRDRPHGARPLRHHRVGRHDPAQRRRRPGTRRAPRRPGHEAARRPHRVGPRPRTRRRTARRDLTGRSPRPCAPASSRTPRPSWLRWWPRSGASRAVATPQRWSMTSPRPSHCSSRRSARSSASWTPGARALNLEAGASDPQAFLVPSVHEFAHVHPAADGSLHLALPAAHAADLVAQGWGRTHPLAGTRLSPGFVMLFGPRDDELAGDGATFISGSTNERGMT